MHCLGREGAPSLLCQAAYCVMPVGRGEGFVTLPPPTVQTGFLAPPLSQPPSKCPRLGGMQWGGPGTPILVVPGLIRAHQPSCLFCSRTEGPLWPHVNPRERFQPREGSGQKQIESSLSTGSSFRCWDHKLEAPCPWCLREKAVLWDDWADWHIVQRIPPRMPFTSVHGTSISPAAQTGILAHPLNQCLSTSYITCSLSLPTCSPSANPIGSAF